ncbi:MAG TPA: FecR domain-containing protein [Bauldia sp.]|nr:FecR domain-containing protein [Bauldia sp.]
MASRPTASARSEAIAWRIRLQDGTTADWEAFAAWIEEDARNGAAYDEVALLDQDLDGPLAVVSRAVTGKMNDNSPPAIPRTRRWVIAGTGTALAAAISAFAIVPSFLERQDDFYAISTKPGEHRAITFGDRNRIVLNGASRVRLDRNDSRFASLESGEATFEVNHDPSAPFTLQIGDNKLVDIGTSFNVVRYAKGHVIAVSEGEILYNPDREAVRLLAGQSLRSDERARRIRLAAIDPSEVGSWRRGLLTYRSASLGEVASDLSRNLGRSVRISPRLASRSFTGTIQIDKNERQLFERLGKLLGIESRRTAHGWDLDEPTASSG